MAYNLLDMAQKRWRRLNAAHHLLPLVRPGVTFVDGGVKQERQETLESRKKAA